jgi:hypothetical protein
MREMWINEGTYVLKVALALVAIFALIALTTWLVRRFGAQRKGIATARGRQRRLAIVEAASVDGSRRIVLIRRDNVEHLMMIGGPTDVVVEPNIDNAVTLVRNAPRAPVATDTLPMPLGEDSLLPLQPQPATSALDEPPALGTPQLHAPQLPLAPMVREDAEWSPQPKPAHQTAPQRKAAPTQEPLVGLVDELARMARAQSEKGGQRNATRPGVQRKATSPSVPLPPAPPPTGEARSNSPDLDLTELTQRIETALRPSAKVDQQHLSPIRVERSARKNEERLHGAGADARQFGSIGHPDQ